MREKLLLTAIVAVAVAFRFTGINWDQGHHLHPDERFLTMVATSMKVPSSFLTYLDPATSPMNPANIGFKFYVYGIFPVIFVKILALLTGLNSYEGITIAGRIVSAFLDCMLVVVVYKIAKLLESRYGLDSKVKFYASFLYAISVLPIQLSHFFAVDTFLNFFMLASFYCALSYSSSERSESRSGFTLSMPKGSRQARTLKLVISAVFFGLALASKITAIFILPLNLFVIVYSVILNKVKDPATKERLRYLPAGRQGFLAVAWNDRKVLSLIFILITYFLIFYISIRVADPYLFQSANIFDPRPSKIFMNNLQELKGFEGPDIWYPPGIQWINKTPIVYSVQNLALWGLGVVQFMLVISGLLVLVDKLTNKKYKKLVDYRLILGATLVWGLAYFLYQASQFAQTMRYMLPLYPFFALAGAFGMVVLINKTQTLLGRFSPLLLTTCYLLLMIWPLAFTSIYTRPHSRVDASVWIYTHVPEGSIILSEHWDDALPLTLAGYSPHYTIKELPVFGQDNEQKWKQMDDLLNEGDYYILSSNRAWGSISQVPQKYPLQSKFYEELFAVRTPYKKVAEFTSYPTIDLSWLVPRSAGEVGKLEIDDSSADESFTVYDHPQVIIFQNTANQDQGNKL